MTSQMSQQKLKRGDVSVDVKDVIPFFEMFLADPSYYVEDAMQLLGDMQESLENGRIILKPKSRELEWIQLWIIQQPEKAFLTDISVRLFREHAVQVSFAELTAKFGEPKLAPLPPPMVKSGGTPYKPECTCVFKAKGKYLEGNLLVTVDGERHGDLNTVTGVTCRRLPPGKSYDFTTSFGDETLLVHPPQFRPPASGITVNQSFDIILDDMPSSDCVSIVQGQATILISRRLLEHLRAAAPGERKTEQERLALIRGRMAEALLKSLTKPVDNL
jgi:hypothetical protein